MVYNILIAILPVISAVLVAIFNNWDKINPTKRHIKEVFENTQETKSEIKSLSEQMTKLQSAQRTGLQTQILEKCRRIQLAIYNGDVDYEEELKQLIILYREYYVCGFNCQGKLYFNDTIAKASEDNNTLVRGLMNTYFSEYQP
ncbi:MAG: hypothetical protein J6C92_14780 [Bacteroidaceae bacterium]|nr:hypothetical protein [Bacteroidaceae bacterium]